MSQGINKTIYAAKNTVMGLREYNMRGDLKLW